MIISITAIRKITGLWNKNRIIPASQPQQMTTSPAKHHPGSPAKAAASRKGTEKTDNALIVSGIICAKNRISKSTLSNNIVHTLYFISIVFIESIKIR